MGKRIDEIKEAAVASLKHKGMYDPLLEFQLESIASAVLTLRIANADIEKLETTRQVEVSKYGEKPVPDPAFKIQRDAMAEITRQLKQLNLTMADLVGRPDPEGPIDELNRQLDALT